MYIGIYEMHMICITFICALLVFMVISWRCVIFVSEKNKNKLVNNGDSYCSFYRKRKVVLLVYFNRLSGASF